MFLKRNSNIIVSFCCWIVSNFYTGGLQPTIWCCFLFSFKCHIVFIITYINLMQALVDSCLVHVVENYITSLFCRLESIADFIICGLEPTLLILSTSSDLYLCSYKANFISEHLITMISGLHYLPTSRFIT